MAALAPLKRLGRGLAYWAAGDFLPIASGGTGATTASGALSNLGLNTVGPPSPNPIDNAEMRVAQRGTSFTNVASGASTPALTLDRWFGYRAGYSAGLSVSQIAGLGFFASAMRIQRASGDTSTAVIVVAQILETSECARFAGQAVTMSAYVRSGANFSPAATGAVLQLVYGTGADEGRSKLISGWTGAGSVYASFTPTTAGVRISVTLAVPATATELAFQFNLAPTGTAGAADYLDVTGVQLEVGTVAGPFDREPIGATLARCQRHYRTGSVRFDGYFSLASAMWSAPEDFQVTMRATPTLTQASTAATNASATTGAVNVTVNGFNDTRTSSGTGAGSWTTTYTASADL